jgi:spore maturation protein CgeB
VKIVIFGLSITSSWGNGHATTFRALASALAARGHRIIFFEHNLEWYESNRDLPRPSFCEVVIFEQWGEVLARARRELADADVAMIGSFFPDAPAATIEVLNSQATKTFYDIDTPITVSRLRDQGSAGYLRREDIPGFDIYFSFTGGPMLCELRDRWGAQRVATLFCSVDPEYHHRRTLHRRYACDMSYMGTYAPDRQPKIEELLCRPARLLSGQRLLVAGPQYPRGTKWPQNVRRIMHLNPRWHAHLYSSSRLVLNVTRRDMVMAGHSPSVRLFEAAACAATIVSDNWPGLETFFEPGREILLPSGADDVCGYLRHASPAELRRIGEAAQARVLAEHTSQKRAQEFEAHVSSIGSRHIEVAAS